MYTDTLMSIIYLKHIFSPVFTQKVKVSSNFRFFIHTAFSKQIHSKTPWFQLDLN